MTESINHETTARNLSYGKKGTGIHLLFHHYCHILRRRKECNLRTGLHWTWRQKFVLSTSLDSSTLQNLPETTWNMIQANKQEPTQIATLSKTARNKPFRCFTLCLHFYLLLLKMFSVFPSDKIAFNFQSP